MNVYIILYVGVAIGGLLLFLEARKPIKEVCFCGRGLWEDNKRLECKGCDELSFQCTCEIL
jgi:hypothetical protein